MNLVLISREEADQQSLMHYRRGGEKKGVRRYQREDGSLTPEGYQHYAEMYGWGKGRKGKAAISEEEYKNILQKAKADDAEYAKEKKDAISSSDPKHVQLSTQAHYKQLDSGRSKSRATLERNAGHTLRAKFYTHQAYKELDESKRLEKEAEREKQLSRSDKEIEQDVKDKIEQFNKKTKAAKEERAKDITGLDEKGKEQKVKNDSGLTLGEKTKLAIVDKNQLEEQKESLKKARDMSDEELQQAITRLQKEKQYSELLNERANREKGPVHQMASKLFQDAAQELARKSLSVVVDKMVNKIKEDQSFKLSDYKDVDPYKLDNNKLQVVAQAFNNAANLARNRNVVNNGGKDPNQGGNNDSPKQNTTGGNNTSSDSGKFTKSEKSQIRSMASSGKSIAEIAKSLGVEESKVKGYMSAAGITIS